MSTVRDRIAAMKKLEEERKIEEGNKKLRIHLTPKKPFKLLSATVNNDILVVPADTAPTVISPSSLSLSSLSSSSSPSLLKTVSETTSLYRHNGIIDNKDNDSNTSTDTTVVAATDMIIKSASDSTTSKWISK